MTESGRFVAFFRNLNLGHRGSPVRAQLEDAFIAAGAVAVRSFQTNGTVIFDPGSCAPEGVVASARVSLREVCGYDDIGPCQPVEVLAAIVDEHHADAWDLLLNTYDRTASAPGLTPGSELSPGLDCVGAGPGWVLTRLRGAGEPVDPNPVIERLTGLRNTTRQLTTVVRLTRSLGLTAHPVPTRNDDLPDDLMTALAAEPEAAAFFGRLPPSHRRQYVQWIGQAVRPETRARRIAEVVQRTTPKSG